MTKTIKTSSFFNSLLTLQNKSANKLKDLVINNTEAFKTERDRLISLQSGEKKVIKDVAIINEFGKKSCFIGRQAKDLRSQIVNCDDKKLAILIKAFENGYQAFGIQSGIKNCEKFMSSLTTQSNKSKTKKSPAKKAEAKKSEGAKRTELEFLDWVLAQYQTEFSKDSQDFIDMITDENAVSICDKHLKVA